jgi:SAM-dependent methyltransferase
LPRAYLSLAEDYQRRATLFPGWRERLVQQLAPRPGDVVIDVGCGPGLNFTALQTHIGPTGRIIGIDESPQLLAVAAHQATRHGWDNIELINAPVHTARPPVDADAALFCAVHDVLQSPAALTNILAHLRPGAAVAAGGWKWPPRWLWTLRTLVTAWQHPLVTDFTGFDQPWRLLADHVTLEVTELSAGYLAHTPTTPATEQPHPPTPTNHARHAPSSRREWFLEQISGVLDPLAQRCEGLPAATIRPILARTWRQEFGRRLNEPTLSDVAAALAQGRPWTQTLWTDGW